MTTTRAARSTRWPASPLIAVYSVVQCVLSGYVAQDGSTNRDAHAIARGILHFLSCLVLLIGATIRADDSVLLALAASLSILVDGGVRALAAGTALTTATKRYSVGLPQSIVYIQVATSIGGTILFHILPRYWYAHGHSSNSNSNSTKSHPSVSHPPLYVSARAHSFSTLLARLSTFLPYHGDLTQLLYACVAVIAASHSAQFASSVLLRPDPAVMAAQRALYDSANININSARSGDVATVWRDETGAIRAVVSIRSREYRDASYASNTKARIRTALAGLVDDFYVQVEAATPLTRSNSSSQVGS